MSFDKRFRNSYFMQCGRKTRFADESAAKKRADEITASGTPMRYYSCPHCNGFHLARVKQKIVTVEVKHAS